MIEQRDITTLREFYEVMAETRAVRAQAVVRILDEKSAPESLSQSMVRALKNAHASLSAIKQGNKGRYNKVLFLDGERDIPVDLTYEIGEMERDILFLEKGESALWAFLEKHHEGFDAHVSKTVEKLSRQDFNCFITDRDGTVNNYCGRYISSVQSIYNAVWLGRFCENNASNPVILTSAPLTNGGLVDISVMPEGAAILGASKGREFIDLQGKRRTFPIEPEKQRVLDEVNERLTKLLKRTPYDKFALIGSGLQFKFGQTTVARQDIGNSIDEGESMAFLHILKKVVKEVDPFGTGLRIEDTGLDVEIILTIETDGQVKDFDKGDGVDFLNSDLSFGMENGPHLICGDTASDVPMLEAALRHSENVFSVFVTRRKDLAKRVTKLCPSAVIVPEPDVLVAALGKV